MTELCDYCLSVIQGNVCPHCGRADDEGIWDPFLDPEEDDYEEEEPWEYDDLV